MLNKLSKLVLFYFAYLPLFVILAINNIKEYTLTIPLKGNNFVIDTPIFITLLVILLLVVGLFAVFLILRTIKNVVPSKENIKIREIKNVEYLSFLVTYLLPFLIDLSGIKQILSFAILFVIIAYLYLDTSLFCVNPLLKIFFRYNIYEVYLDKQKYFLLSRNRFNDEGKAKLHVKKLDRNILIE